MSRETRRGGKKAPDFAIVRPGRARFGRMAPPSREEQAGSRRDPRASADGVESSSGSPGGHVGAAEPAVSAVSCTDRPPGPAADACAAGGGQTCHQPLCTASSCDPDAS
nr:unnamed protein product [Digitaria exilis]